jgi:hypothetical protein
MRLAWQQRETIMQVNIGKGITVDVTVESLPAKAMEHVVYIGLRNVLMDAHANVTEKEYPVEADRLAAARAMADKKLAALMAGEVRKVAERGPRGDAVAREATRLAEIAFMAYPKDKRDAAVAKAMANAQLDEKAARRAILAQLVKARDLTAQAERNLAALKDAPEADVSELDI